MKVSCLAFEEWLAKRVDRELMDVYMKGKLGIEDDRRKTVRSGYEAIEKTMTSEKNKVAHSYLDQILLIKVSVPAETVEDACATLKEMERLRLLSEAHAKSTGTVALVTGALLVQVATTSIRYDKHNGIPATVNDKIEKAKLDDDTQWDDLLLSLLGTMKTLKISDLINKKPAATDSVAFKAQMHKGIEEGIERYKAEQIAEETKKQGWLAAHFASGSGGSGGQAGAQSGGGQYQAFAAGAQGAGGTPYGGGGGARGRGGNAYGRGGGGGQRGVCFDFQKGKCDRGDSCRFEHVMAAPAAAGGQGAKKPVCHFDGTCTSRFCTYDHPKGKARSSTPLTGKRK